MANRHLTVQKGYFDETVLKVFYDKLFIGTFSMMLSKDTLEYGFMPAHSYNVLSEKMLLAIHERLKKLN